MRTFRDAVRSNEFTLTAELNLNQRADAQTLLRQVELLGPLVDAIQTTDNPYSQVQISALAAASLILGRGFDAVPQFNCRDRNRTALESDLLGAMALGVESVLLLRGDAYKNSADSKAVFDLDAKELIAKARSLSGADGFYIGGVATVFKPVAGWQPDELNAKVDAGAQFIQTQLCFDTNVLRRYIGHLVSAKLTWRSHIVIGVATLPSAEAARWLQRNLRGALMPDELVERMEQAQDPEEEGVKICAELMQEFSEIPGVSGANLMTLGNIETIPAAISASGLRTVC